MVLLAQLVNGRSEDLPEHRAVLGVDNGSRTRDIQVGNLVLCLLSYVHKSRTPLGALGQSRRSD
jgi:hypothetical protein